MPTTDKEKLAKYARNDYERHKEARQQKRKEYKETHKEEVRQKDKEYRERKKAEETPEQAEARRAYQRQYYHAHREHLIQCRKERAKVVFETLSVKTDCVETNYIAPHNGATEELPLQLRSSSD